MSTNAVSITLAFSAALAIGVAACGGIAPGQPTGSSGNGGSSDGTSGGGFTDPPSSGSGTGTISGGGTTGKAGPSCGSAPVSSAPNRGLTFHFTNTTDHDRWVATGGHGCDAFDVTQGNGAPFRLHPPFQCGCECARPSGDITWQRVHPGAAVDVVWDGLTYDLVGGCVDGPANGCADGQKATTQFGVAQSIAPATYDVLLRVTDEDLAHGGAVDTMTEQGSGSSAPPPTTFDALCPARHGVTVDAQVLIPAGNAPVLFSVP